MKAWVIHRGVRVEAFEVARQLDGETRALVFGALFRLARLCEARALDFADPPLKVRQRVRDPLPLLPVGATTLAECAELGAQLLRKPSRL